MENALDFEKRLSKVEQRVSDNFEYMKTIVTDFKEYMGKSSDAMTKVSETMIKVQVSLEQTSEKQSRLEQQFCENQKEVSKKFDDLETKIDENEELHKVDTRPIMKNIISKVITGVIIAGLGIGLLISLLS
jgi:hypothetical protein